MLAIDPDGTADALAFLAAAARFRDLGYGPLRQGVGPVVVLEDGAGGAPKNGGVRQVPLRLEPGGRIRDKGPGTARVPVGRAWPRAPSGRGRATVGY